MFYPKEIIMKMKNLSTRKRVVFLGLFISILLFALTIRLAHIQIILGKTYSKKALEQRTLSQVQNSV